MKFRAELAQIADPEVVWGSSELCSISTFQPQHVVWGNPLRGQPWTTSVPCKTCQPAAPTAPQSL